LYVIETQDAQEKLENEMLRKYEEEKRLEDAQEQLVNKKTNKEKEYFQRISKILINIIKHFANIFIFYRSVNNNFNICFFITDIIFFIYKMDLFIYYMQKN
jgi:uncharacterized membrane protein (DUF106 family)